MADKQLSPFFVQTLLIVALAAGSLAATGCGQKAEQDSEHLFEAQEKALEKAKAVEDQLKEAAQKQRELIEEQSQ